MASFQILDKTEKAIAINVLDKDACILWGKEVHPKSYASPYIRKEFTNPDNLDEDSEKFIRARASFNLKEARNDTANWYDWIGARIAYSEKNPTWESVLKDLIDNNAVFEQLVDGEGNSIRCKFAPKKDRFDLDNMSNEEFAEYTKELGLNTKKEISNFIHCYIFLPYVQLVEVWSRKGYLPINNIY